MYYIVYNLPHHVDKPDEQPYELTIVKNGRIYGPQAQKAKEPLIESGWPKRTTDNALHGSVIWATLPILEDTDTPKDGWIQNVNFI